MARPQKFSDSQILDGALSAITDHGVTPTITQVAKKIGAPIGSIYHRFESREELFISLWLRSIDRFHVGLVEAAQIPDPDEALVKISTHIPQYCRAHPDEALAMTLYRHPVLVRIAPESLASAVNTINDEVFEALAELCVRRFGRTTPHLLELISTAVQQLPYGLIRPHIGGPIPEWLDEVVVVSSTAIIKLGDQVP